MEKQVIRTKILRKKYLKSMPNNQFLKVKDFMELKDKGLKDREEKIKRKVE